MEGIVIGTAILWALTNVLVLPLCNLLLRRRMVVAGVQPAGFDQLAAEDKQHWKQVATECYILVDVLVLAIAGLIGGLMGYWFIGVSTQAKSWPGIIAFVGCSFLGLALVKSAGSI